MQPKTKFDEKGKFYTQVVDKVPVFARIQTTGGMIHGTIYLRPGKRLKDSLNESKGFIAVTNASVFKVDGELLLETGFLALNTGRIVWVTEENPPETGEQPGGQA